MREMSYTVYMPLDTRSRWTNHERKNDMRTIIAGSRHITDPAELEAAMRDIDWHPSAIITGGARGADQLGNDWANANGLPLAIYYANWRECGRRAGPLRNEEMAKNADALVALWDGDSAGTQNMINAARAKGLRVHVHRVASATGKPA